MAVGKAPVWTMVWKRPRRRAPPLISEGSRPPAGVMVGGAAGVLALLATAGLGFAYAGSKRRVTGRHTATGRHAA